MERFFNSLEVKSSIVSSLLKRQVDVNLSNLDGITPQTEAAVLGRDGLIDPLVDAGANVNVISHTGRTPLSLAASFSRDVVKAAQRLLLRGAKIDLADEEDLTPLCYAFQQDNRKRAILLTKSGARHDRLEWQDSGRQEAKVATMRKRLHLGKHSS